MLNMCLYFDFFANTIFLSLLFQMAQYDLMLSADMLKF